MMHRLLCVAVVGVLLASGAVSAPSEGEKAPKPDSVTANEGEQDQGDAFNAPRTVVPEPNQASDKLFSSVVTHVSPRALKTLTKKADKLVFLALYIPGLPKWHLHFQAVLAAVGHHFQNNSNVAVVVGDCDMYPSYIRQFGIRSFPSLHFFPPHLDNAVPFPLRYLDNATALTYVEEIERNLHVTSMDMEAVKVVHEDVVAFMQAQATLDFEIMWKTGGERRRRLQQFERRFRDVVMGETLEASSSPATGGSETTAGAGAEAGASNDTVVVDPEAEAARQEAARAKAARVKARAQAKAKERESLQPEQLPLDELEQRAETVMSGPAPTVDEDAEAAALEPVFRELQHQLDLLKLQEAKLRFYRKLLKDLKEYGSGSIARQLNANTKELFRKSDLLPQSDRDLLLMKISVLRKFTDALF
jgi:hypothetical protein